MRARIGIDQTGEPDLPARLGVTADWQARSLSVVGSTYVAVAG